MAGDDSDSDTDDEEDEENPHNIKKNGKSDPAIYKASKEGEDDGVLFTMPAAWNRFSIVLRDAGVLKFVKYVSQSAKGDRWDVVGEWGVADDDEEVGDGDVGGNIVEEEEEEEWKGIVDDEESEEEEEEEGEEEEDGEMGEGAGKDGEDE